MIFFVVMGGLFTLYALDLLLLVVVAAVARAHEVVVLARRDNTPHPPHAYEKFKRNKRNKLLRTAVSGKQDIKGAAAGGRPQGVVGLEGGQPALTTLKLKAPAGPEDELTTPPVSGTEGGAGGLVRQVSTGGTSHCSCPSTPLPPAPEPQMTAASARAGSVGSSLDSSSSSGSVCVGMSGEVLLPTCPALPPHPAPTQLPAEGSGPGDDTRVCSPVPSPTPNPLLQRTQCVMSKVHAEHTHVGGVEGAEAGAPVHSPERGHSPSAPPLPLPTTLLGAPRVHNASAGSLSASSVGGPGLQHAISDASVLSAGASCSSVGGAGGAGGQLHSAGGSVASSWATSMGSGAFSADIVIAAEMVGQGGDGRAGDWVKGGGTLGAQLSSDVDGCDGVTGGRGDDSWWRENEWPRPAHEYPLVLIQLPMYNEEAHAGLIIERCCRIAWPRSRLLIQVLDDSTKAHIRDKVDAAATLATEAGHPVQVLRRTNRQGFKAGAMVDGLVAVAPWGFKYVAIFDADFDPPEDFLEETVGPLEADDKLAYVQTRWLNPAHTFLTWAQKVNLGFHFDVEQRARSHMGWFFNFNGTAGVWRLQAIEEAGGWQSDTVVEDMDLSLRAYLGGWRALYLPHVGCINEVPDTLATYRTQQFRWLSGPMQILAKAFWTIWTARNIHWAKRANCYWFFGRYILFAAITLAVLLVPPVTLLLDPWVWDWARIYFVVSVNFALAVYLYITPFSLLYLLFSIGVGYFKAWAMLGGLLGTKKSKSWKVTAKKGVATVPAPAAAPAAPGTTGAAPASAAPPAPPGCRARIKAVLSRAHAPYATEVVMAVYYGALAGLSFAGIQRPMVAGDSWVGGSGPNLGVGIYCAIMAVIFIALSLGDMYL